LSIGCRAGDSDAAVDMGQGSEARGELVINEVSPRPGDGPDWIELLNRSESPVDLCAWFLTDPIDRLDHYLPLGGVMPPQPCPSRPLAAGAYLVVYADDTASVDGAPIDPLHAPFELSSADEVHLVATDGVSGDGILYLHPADGEGFSLSRYPDGEGLFFVSAPSPGAAN
jgi:hypothetical protein